MKLHQLHQGEFFTVANETEEFTYLRITSPDGRSGWYMWAPMGWVIPNVDFDVLNAAFQEMQKGQQNG